MNFWGKDSYLQSGITNILFVLIKIDCQGTQILVYSSFIFYYTFIISSNLASNCVNKVDLALLRRSELYLLRPWHISFGSKELHSTVRPYFGFPLTSLKFTRAIFAICFEGLSSFSPYCPTCYHCCWSLCQFVHHWSLYQLFHHHHAWLWCSYARH